MNRQEMEAMIPEGYQLVSPEVGNQATPLHLLCPQKHDWPRARIGNIVKNGSRCPVCLNKRRSKEQRSSQEEAKEKLEAMGWKLLSKYTKAHSKVKIKCITCDHKRDCLFYNIKDTCRKCWKNRSRDQCMVKLENEMNQRGGTIIWIEDPDKVSTSKVSYKCINDHIVNTSYNKLTDLDQQCRKCSGLARLTIEEIKSRLWGGYKYVSGDYKGIHSELIFICPSGHEYPTTWNKHQTGYGCSHRDCCNTSPLRDEDIINRAEELDIEWLGGEYNNVESPLIWKCLNNKKHPSFEKSIRQLHYSKSWPCPECIKGLTRSKGEIECFEFVKSLGLDVVENDRTILGGLEIDILIPEKRFGIEFCGLLYHSEKTEKKKIGVSRDYHYNKCKLAKAHNHRIFFLFEDEWAKRKERVKDYIRMKLLSDFEIVKADDCDIVELTSKEYIPFIEENHIQGKGSYSKKIAYGLTHPDHGLVYVLTAQKNHWNSSSNLYEVDRFVSKTDLRVKGGASKLFSVLLEELKAIGITEVRTYSDRRYSWGNLYEQMGFKKSEKSVHLTEDYSWVKGMERRSRQSMRLKEHEKDKGQTVSELRREQGWSKIYGCGKDIWIYKIESENINKEEFCKLHNVEIEKTGGDNVILKWGDVTVTNTFENAFRVIRKLISI